MSGKHPYYDLKKDAVVLIQISYGQIPSRPQDTKVSSFLTDDLWIICQQCWTLQHTERLSMREIISKLGVVINRSHPDA
jgi:hypothetical protein